MDSSHFRTEFYGRLAFYMHFAVEKLRNMLMYSELKPEQCITILQEHARQSSVSDLSDDESHVYGFNIYIKCDHGRFLSVDVIFPHGDCELYEFHVSLTSVIFAVGEKFKVPGDETFLRINSCPISSMDVDVLAHKIASHARVAWGEVHNRVVT